MIDRYIHFYNHERIQLKLEWRRSRCATPLNTSIPLKKAFFGALPTMWCFL